MIGHRLAVLGFVVLLLCGFAGSCWATQGVGTTLGEAMKNRASGSVEEVIRDFQAAAAQTANPAQKASILAILGEFLLERSEWEKAIEVHEAIIAAGPDSARPGALYGLAQASLGLNSPEQARSACARLQAEYPGNPLEAFARDMQQAAPTSVHATLGRFLTETSSPRDASEISAVVSPPEPSVSAPEASGGPLDRPLETMPVPEPFTREKSARPGPPPEPVGENRLTVSALGWNSYLGGHVDSKGMNLGLGGDGNFRSQTRLALKGSWKFSSKDQLRLDYSHFDHHGTLRRGVTFDNLAYNPGASLQLRTSFFDVGLSRLLGGSDNGSWKFLYGVKFTKMFLRIAQQMAAGTRAGEINTTLPLPYLGIEGSTRLWSNVSLSGALKHFSLARSGGSGRLTDADITLLFGRDDVAHPAETKWYGTLGYRYVLLHGDVDNDSSTIRYSGPTIGLESWF